jgi:hypothetical protein
MLEDTGDPIPRKLDYELKENTFHKAFQVLECFVKNAMMLCNALLMSGAILLNQ